MAPVPSQAGVHTATDLQSIVNRLTPSRSRSRAAPSASRRTLEGLRSRLQDAALVGWWMARGNPINIEPPGRYDAAGVRPVALSICMWQDAAFT